MDARTRSARARRQPRPASVPGSVMDRRPARGHTPYVLLSWLGDRRMTDGAWLAAILIVAGFAAYLLTKYSTPVPEPTPRSLAVAQAESWIQANLARETPLSADPRVALDLGVYGFTAAHAVEVNGRGTQSWDTDEFIVSTPTIREVVSRSLAQAAARTSTAPAAVFGRAADRVEVCMIVHASASNLDEHLASDARDRAAAGRALMRNPRVMLDAALRRQISRGELDLRAATVLALLAARTDVHITEIVTDRSEAAAGRPARMLTLTLRNADALATTLQTLPAAYAPAAVGKAGAATRLEWSVGLAPMSILA
jgi:hypothetical protein